MLNNYQPLLFSFGVHAIVSAGGVGGVDGVVRIIDILFAECFHGLMKISIIITN
jgi:nucleoside phosphorylase